MGNKVMSVLKKVLFAAAVVATVAAVNPQNTEAAAKPKMDRTKVTCTAKERFTLKVKNAGGKKVTWSSTKKSVATVSKKGNVITKKAGKATIKAKVGSKTVKCTVTVKKNAKQPWMTTKTKTLHVGESFLLIEGWFTDYESVFSFNDRVATASGSGRITATGIGTTKVLVNRGKDSNGTYRDYFCTVTVVPGVAKTCKHCWMDSLKYNSSGKPSCHIALPTCRDEGWEACKACGFKAFGSDEIDKHQEETGHSGSVMGGGGADMHNFNKFGAADLYCRTCGLTK